MHIPYSIGESRLLHLTIDDINAQRLKAGASPVNTTQPIGTTTRSAEANAIGQAGAYQANLGARQFAGANQRYADTAQYITDNPQAFTDKNGKYYGNDILSQASQGVKDTKSYASNLTTSGQKMMDQADGQLSVHNLAGSTQYYSPSSGTVVGVNGSIDQGAFDRLLASGMTVDEAMQRINSLRPSIQYTMGGGQGLGSAVADKKSSDQYLSEQIATVPRTIQRQVGVDKNGNPIMQTVTNPDYDKQVNAVKERVAQEQSTMQAKRDAQKKDEMATVLANNTSSVEQKTTKTNEPPAVTEVKNSLTTEANTTADAIIAKLPQGSEWMAPLIKQAYDNANASIAGANTLYASREALANKLHESASEILQKSLERANKQYETMAGEIKANDAESQKTLQAQKENAELEQKLESEKNTRQAIADNQANLDSMRARIAFGGATGSSNANVAYEKARASGEQAILDMKQMSLVKAQELSLKYTALMQETHQKYQSDLVSAWNGYETRLTSIENSVRQNDQKQAEMLNSAAKDLYEKTSKAKENQANNLMSFVKEANDEKAQMERLQYQEKAMDAREKANFERQQQVNARQANTLRLSTFKEARANMEQIQSYKALQATDYRILNIDNLYASYKSDSSNQNKRAILADALQYALNKFGDSNSAVLIGEYKRYVDSQGGIDTIKNSITNFIEGGGKITPSMLDAMVSSIKIGRDSALSQFQKDIIPIKSTLDTFNYSNPDHFIDLGEVVPPDYLPVDYETKNAVDTLFDPKAKDPNVSLGTSAEIRKNLVESGVFIPSPISLLNENQFMSLPRADRHNNPTAFTTDIAKQAGLIDGVDYVAGDTFPGNSKYRTAFLLGDPSDLTIKVIDKIGFTKNSGGTRWTYTDKLGLNDDKWNGMTYQQKVQAIQQMNRYEGGTGILFSNIS